MEWSLTAHVFVKIFNIGTHEYYTFTFLGHAHAQSSAGLLPRPEHGLWKGRILLDEKRDTKQDKIQQGWSEGKAKIRSACSRSSH